MMLSRLCAVVLAGLIWLLNPAVATAGLFPGATPDNLGITDNHLTACPSTPNCIVSQGGDADHAIDPIRYNGDRATVRQALEQVLGVVPRTTIVEATGNYLHAESSSRLLGFVDDVEFYFPADESVIQVRSAARLGESDLGVNQRRIEQIRLALKDLGFGV